MGYLTHTALRVPFEKTTPAANGILASLESTVENDNDIFGGQDTRYVPEAPVNGDARDQEEEEEEEEEVELGDESDEDVSNQAL
jgi:hypothetical protein